MTVTTDPRKTGRMRVTCRDEDELACVKAMAERVKTNGARVLRDQLYPVEVDKCVQDSGDGSYELVLLRCLRKRTK